MSPFFILLGIQTVLIVGVLLVLRGVLEKMLLDMACLKFELWKFVNEHDEVTAPPPIKNVNVTISKNLGSKHKQRVLKKALEHFGPECKVDFTVNKKTMGGMIIKFGEHSIDCSLHGRLKQTGIVK